MLFELILRQLYLGKGVLNRWYYNGTGIPASVDLSFALVSAFGGIPDGVTGEFPALSIMAQLAGIQHTELKYVELIASALYDVSDFYNVPYPPSQSGVQGGTAMSSFNAYAVQSNRVRTDVRRGNKRFAGVSEQYVGTGGIVEAGIDDQLQTLADALGDNLVYDDEGNTLTFQPCILSLEKHPPDAEHDADWYRIYGTNAEQLDHAALGINWQAKPYVTTQNSRKT